MHRLIYYNFSIPALQFTCIDDTSDPLYNSVNNGFKIAKELIEKANNISSNLNPSVPGNVVLPDNDFKVRYTNIVDCSDIFIVENNEGNIQKVPGVLNIYV